MQTISRYLAAAGAAGLIAAVAPAQHHDGHADGEHVREVAVVTNGDQRVEVRTEHGVTTVFVNGDRVARVDLAEPLAAQEIHDETGEHVATVWRGSDGRVSVQLAGERDDDRAGRERRWTARLGLDERRGRGAEGGDAQGETAPRVMIGVTMRPDETVHRDDDGRPERLRGARVTGLVQDGPAERSGLEVGDLIIGVNDGPGTPGAIRRTLAGLDPGELVDVKLLRADGSYDELVIELDRFRGDAFGLQELRRFEDDDRDDLEELLRGRRELADLGERMRIVTRELMEATGEESEELQEAIGEISEEIAQQARELAERAAIAAEEGDTARMLSFLLREGEGFPLLFERERGDDEEDVLVFPFGRGGEFFERELEEREERLEALERELEERADILAEELDERSQELDERLDRLDTRMERIESLLEQVSDRLNERGRRG